MAQTRLSSNQCARWQLCFGCLGKLEDEDLFHHRLRHQKSSHQAFNALREANSEGTHESHKAKMDELGDSEAFIAEYGAHSEDVQELASVKVDEIAAAQVWRGRVRKSARNRAGEECNILRHDELDVELAWKVMFKDGLSDWYNEADIEEALDLEHDARSQGTQELANAELDALSETQDTDCPPEGVTSSSQETIMPQAGVMGCRVSEFECTVSQSSRCFSLRYFPHGGPRGTSKLLLKAQPAEAASPDDTQALFTILGNLISGTLRHKRQCKLVIFFDVLDLCRPSVFDMPEIGRRFSEWSKKEENQVFYEIVYAYAIIHSGSYLTKKVIDLVLAVFPSKTPPVFVESLEDAHIGVGKFLDGLQLTDSDEALGVDDTWVEPHNNYHISSPLEPVPATTEQLLVVDVSVPKKWTVEVAEEHPAVTDLSDCGNADDASSVAGRKQIVAGEEVQKIGLVCNAVPAERLVIKRVHGGSWADSMGIKRGDVLEALNGVEVCSLSGSEFKAMIQQRPLKLQISVDEESSGGECI